MGRVSAVKECKLSTHAVYSMECYILSWYNPHFWVFRSVRLQHVTMTIGINPRAAQTSASGVGYTSAERKQPVMLCCDQMSFRNSYTFRRVELNLTEARQKIPVIFHLKPVSSYIISCWEHRLGPTASFTPHWSRSLEQHEFSSHAKDFRRFLYV